MNFPHKEGVDADAVNAFMLRFIDQAIEANELTYGGYDEFGFVCLARGSVNEEQRALIEAHRSNRNWPASRSARWSTPGTRNSLSCRV